MPSCPRQREDRRASRAAGVARTRVSAKCDVVTRLSEEKKKKSKFFFPFSLRRSASKKRSSQSSLSTPPRGAPATPFSSFLPLERPAPSIMSTVLRAPRGGVCSSSGRSTATANKTLPATAAPRVALALPSRRAPARAVLRCFASAPASERPGEVSCRAECGLFCCWG